jgi:hypothetical protein
VGVTTVSSAFETRLAVYQGSSLAGLVPRAAAAGASSFAANARIRFEAIAGTEYAIAVDGVAGAGGTVSLRIDPVPVADSWILPAAIAGTGEWSANNRGAGWDEGEPFHAGLLGGSSVWWKWTAPSNHSYFVETKGSDFDTVLAVYENIDGTLRWIAANDDSTQGTGSRVEFTAESGRDYRFAVDGVGGAEGAIQLRVAALDPGRFVIVAMPPGELILKLQGEPGRHYHVDASQDLAEWHQIRTEQTGVPFSIARPTNTPPVFLRATLVP